MIITSQFKVDLFQMKHTKDPEGLLEAMKQSYAAQLGRELIKLFPYEKNEERSFKGELPGMSINREHEYNDLYRRELVVIEFDKAKRILDLFARNSKLGSGGVYLDIKSLLGL